MKLKKLKTQGKIAPDSERDAYTLPKEFNGPEDDDDDGIHEVKIDDEDHKESDQDKANMSLLQVNRKPSAASANRTFIESPKPPRLMTHYSSTNAVKGQSRTLYSKHRDANGRPLEEEVKEP